MEQVEVREGARRQHRVISLFCVVQCWLRGWDGVRIDRDQLERLLGLQKFKQTRIDWMNEDFWELFPYRMNVYDDVRRDFFWSIRLSRRPFDENPVVEMFEMWEQARQEHFTGLYEGLRPFLADGGNNDERLLSSYLSLSVQGQISPRSVPPVAQQRDGGDEETKRAVQIVFEPRDCLIRDFPVD
jgi:hypothetical protein